MNEDFYQIYLEEVKDVIPCTQEEEQELTKQLCQGNREPRKRLIEGKLEAAMRLAMEYHGQGLPAGDLIQEANMALILAVDTYAGGEFHTYMEERIRQALKDALDQQKQEIQVEVKLAARVNELKKVSEQLVSDLGREASLEELADHLSLPVGEVQELVKLSMNALNSGEKWEGDL